MEMLHDSKQQYQKEQDHLLQTILDLRFFNPWRHVDAFVNEKSLRVDANLELYITSTCDQHCEYCYLRKYPQLYPAEFNKPELILDNLEKICRWITVNKFDIPVLDLYSGDIWGTSFGWDVLDIIYKYLVQGMQIGHIMIASNCGFVDNMESMQTIQQYIYQFQDIGCPIVFSISVDGKIIDEKSRPKNVKQYTDNFYEILGAFAIKNNYLFHPMISPHNVKYWKENYDWWKEYLHYYNYDMDAIMTLEVRDSDWTEESIKDYCELLKYMADDFFHTKCHDDSEALTSAIVGSEPKFPEATLGGYIPWCIGFVDTFTGCSIANHLTIRVGDLAICPCHRTAYDQYLYGYLNIENNNITTVKAVNPSMAIKILMSNILTTSPKCDSCPIQTCCLRGCYGSQIESVHDPFFPSENVCSFFKEKYKSILHYYRDRGVIDILKQQYSAEHPCGARAALILQLNDVLEEIENGMGSN